MHEEFLKRVVDSPARALDKTVDTSKSFVENISNREPLKRAEKYWKTLGPGLTTGAADDDPSGIATYSQTGAQYGFQLLWLAGFTFPLMAVVQEMCARIGLITGRGLAGTIRMHYPKWVLYLCTILLFAANSFNIGADLGAMAKASQLLFPRFDFGMLIVFFTIVSLLLQIFTKYEQYAKYLKWLALILLSYVLSALSVNLDLSKLAVHTLLPAITFSKEQIILICGILGTTISPYLFFWQTSQEVEEEILRGKKTIVSRRDTPTTKEEISNMRIDIWSGMFISNIVMYFIIAACAATLFANGVHTITTAADAATALRPIAGENAFLLFAIGIIGTGMLAVPILAGSASYALSETFKWRSGLYLNLKQAPSFYGIIIISMFVGLAINFSGIDPIKALIYSAVINGLIAPVILALIVLLSSNKKIMGLWTNHPFTTLLGWITVIAMTISGIAAIIALFFS